MTKDEALNHALQLVSNLRTHSWTVADTQFVISAIKEALAQPDYKPTSDYQLVENAQGELERIKLVQTGVGIGQRAEEAYEAAKERSWVGVSDEMAQPEQDGKCKYCTDGCPACDARKLPEQERFLVATIGNWGRVEWADGVFPSLGDKMYSDPRTWVGLTDEEIRLQWSEFWEAECHPWVIEFARAIEAAHGIKENT